MDPWLLLDLMSFAVAMTLMTWRTGGLEAAIVLHSVNNVLGIGLSIAFGELGSAFIDTDSASTPLQTTISTLGLAVATAIVWRTHPPPPARGAGSPSTPSSPGSGWPSR
jgi:membrane protease YdiL (CAAX protease family)